ncbi:MAG: class I adenylate-forming enzyme family protein [Acidimicrobiia bacterium]
MDDPVTWLALYGRRADDDSPAVVGESEHLTSRELTRLAAGAADWLDSIGVPPARPVAALVSTTVEAFALAVAGAATHRPLAPLGPRLTATELRAALLPLAPSVVVAEPGAADLAREAAGALGIRVEVHPELQPSGRPLSYEADPLEPAAILHTSGTSGQPKPVPYPHGRLALRARVNAGLLGLGPGSIYATASPFHHIAGLGMLFVALGSGAALCPLPRFTVDSWAEVIGRGTTHALLVPSMVEQLLDQDRLVRGDLRCLQYGASRIDPGTLRRLLAALPDVDLVQIYGQTEGSPITALTLDDHRRAAAGDDRLLASAGRAAPGVELIIHAPDAGGVGEVWARAAHLMKPDPDGWLRTGDLGRLDAEGYLTLSGRTGDMIIRGGENVYPAEVEDVVRALPGVADVAVVGLPDQRLGQLVAAFVVPADRDAPLDPDELRAATRHVLAGFKVPERWEFLDELPRNATGKVLKRALAPTEPA